MLKKSLLAVAACVIYPYFIVGFYRSVCEREPEISSLIANDIASTDVLSSHAFVLFYQDSSPQCHERLLVLLEQHPEIPWNYAFFPHSAAYNEEQNCVELIDALFKRGDSLSSIMEMLRMSIPDNTENSPEWRNYKKRIMEHLANIAIDDSINHRTAEAIGEVIVYAFNEKDSKHHLIQICSNIFALLIGSPKSSLMDLQGILNGIAIVDTNTLLDICLPDDIEISYNVKQAFLINYNGINIISDCDPLIVQNWIDRNPDERLGKMAGLIDPVCIEAGTVSLTNIAAFIINHNNVSRPTLDKLLKCIEPKSWSGELSAILQVRKNVVASLITHQNKTVCDWATESVDYLDARIKGWQVWENARDRDVIHPFEP